MEKILNYFYKLRLSTKLLVLILSSFFVIYIGALFFLITNLRESMLNDAYKAADTHAKEYSNLIKADISTEMYLVRTLANAALIGTENITHEQRYEVIKTIIYNFIYNNLQLNSCAISFELSHYDPNWKENYGRIRLTWYRNINKELTWKIDSLNLTGDIKTNNYYKCKINKLEFVSDPYMYSYTNSENDKVLVTSSSVPVLYYGKFVGLAGVDLELSRFQNIIDSIKPMEKGYATLIAYTGVIVAHPNIDFVGDTIHKAYSKATSEKNLLERIQKGESISYIDKDPIYGKDYYYSICPIWIGKSIKPWALAIAVPMDTLTEDVNKALRLSILIGFIGLLLIFIIIWTISKNITKPLKKTTSVIKDLAIGDIDISKKYQLKYQDEIGEIATSVNTLIDGLNKTAIIAKQIGEGNLSAEFTVLSEKDVLGKSLLEMRNSLYKAAQEEIERKKEDEKRNWATEGLAQFGDILRQNNDKIDVLSFQIIKNLVKYLKINQGGLFIINDESKTEHFIELKACYAYDRRKYLNKKIEIGEGLVGACFQEKKTIYITDVPDNYIEITSGLGKENPHSILIVPLKLNEEIYGVLELASFHIFPPHEIEFIEKISESIASTISSVRINERTAKLLEQSQLQAEQMRSQEEEMRQNMEELSATQEEMLRKSQDADEKIDNFMLENENLKNTIEDYKKKYNIED